MLERILCRWGLEWQQQIAYGHSHILAVSAVHDIHGAWHNISNLCPMSVVDIAAAKSCKQVLVYM